MREGNIMTKTQKTSTQSNRNAVLPRRTRLSLAIAAALPAFLVAPEESSAQSSLIASGDNPLLEELIIVTARKREEAIQDIPLTVEAVPEEDIERYLVNDFSDIAGLITATEHIGDTGNPFASEIVIRGGGVGRQLNVDGGTGLYANGINVQGGNFGGRSLWEIDTFDALRYEVLKGPQGALYGRNALGGVINVISKQPDPENNTLDLDLGLFDNEGYSIAAYANGAVGDTVALRVAGRVYDQSEGFYFNTASNDYID